MFDALLVIAVLGLAGFLIWKFTVKRVDEIEVGLGEDTPNTDFPLATDYNPATEVDEEKLGKGKGPAKKHDG